MARPPTPPSIPWLRPGGGAVALLAVLSLLYLIKGWSALHSRSCTHDAADADARAASADRQAPGQLLQRSPYCSTARLAVLVVIRVPPGRQNRTAKGLKAYMTKEEAWASVANKRAYCRLHGYALYVVSRPLQALRPPTGHWDKFPALQAVMAAHPEHDWVFLVDADTVFLTLDRSLSEVLALAAHEWRQRRRAVHIIAARDASGLNSGSMFFRTSNWTMRFLERTWDVDFDTARNCSASRKGTCKWHDQAVLHLMLKRNIAGMADHTLLVAQRLINAHPHWERHRVGDTHEDGDLLIHMPYDFKENMTHYLCQARTHADAWCPGGLHAAGAHADASRSDAELARRQGLSGADLAALVGVWENPSDPNCSDGATVTWPCPSDASGVAAQGGCAGGAERDAPPPPGSRHFVDVRINTGSSARGGSGSALLRVHYAPSKADGVCNAGWPLPPLPQPYPSKRDCKPP